MPPRAAKAAKNGGSKPSKKPSKPKKDVDASSAEESVSTSSSSDDGNDSEEYQEPDADMAEEDEDDEEAVKSEEDEGASDSLLESEDEGKPKKRKGGSTASGSAKKKPKVEDGGKNTREIKTLPRVKAPNCKAEVTQVLPSTMKFLEMLAKNNDRDWFAANDALYRHALLNWTTWINGFVPIASGVDWTVPELPAKDLINRIYRDVRFSKDKTPYKRNLACTLSRTGRKSAFALYYIQIQPGNRSILAAGKWQPSGDETKTLRAAIFNDSKPLRKLLEAKDFVEYFGEAKAVKGKRSSVFGHDDELKNAPKMEGVDKKHPDIDLLKLRSIAVTHTFTDEQVLADDWMQQLEKCMKVATPFVQYLNEIIFPSPPDEDDDAENGAEDDGEEGRESGNEEEE